jgi:hypothetical protein
MDAFGAQAAIILAAAILATAALAGQLFIPARVDAAGPTAAPATA